MNFVFKLFSPKIYLQVILLVILEQMMVAGSTYSLIKATQALIENNPTPVWFISFVSLLFLPYIPGIYSRKKLEQLCQEAYKLFLNNRLLATQNPTTLWAQRGRKSSYLLGLGPEGLSIIKQVAHTVFDLATIILNITFNLFVIGLTLDLKIGLAFLIGSLISMLLIKNFSKRTELINTASQKSKNIFLIF